MIAMNTPLKKIRVLNDRTLKEVADAIDVDPSNLSRIERGLQAATPQLAEKIATYFDNKISEIEVLYPQRFSN
jgi:transcriptional regulator with XRE-family HTH domain